LDALGAGGEREGQESGAEELPVRVRAGLVGLGRGRVREAGRPNPVTARPSGDAGTLTAVGDEPVGTAKESEGTVGRINEGELIEDELPPVANSSASRPPALGVDTVERGYESGRAAADV
jgi:hypothetical protein